MIVVSEEEYFGVLRLCLFCDNKCINIIVYYI